MCKNCCCHINNQISNVALFFIVCFITVPAFAFIIGGNGNETVEEKLLSLVQPHYAEVKSAKTFGSYGHLSKLNSSSCSLSPELQEEIANYRPIIQQIVDTVLHGSLKGSTYKELINFLDRVGGRPSGSDNLEVAINYLDKTLMDMQLANHNLEPVLVPVHRRGKESVQVLSPVPLPLQIRGYGMSVNTPPNGITGEVIHLQGLDEVELRKDEINGRVVFFSSYADDDEINAVFGPAKASRYGALAILCKSPYKNIYTVVALYDDDGDKAPAAIVGQEDADKLEDLIYTGNTVTIQMVLLSSGSMDEAKQEQSWNLISDWNGKENATEYVLLMSHSDSWDQGEGAQDDGVGIFLALQTLAVFKELGIRARRTVRNVIFTTEEIGLLGVTAWVEWHKNDLDKYSAGLEADQGCLQATGLTVSGTREAACIVLEIEKIFEEVAGFDQSLLLSEMKVLPTNLFVVGNEGLPGIELNGDRWGEYYELHHTAADSRNTLDPGQLDKCLALMASTTFVVADLTEKLPREKLPE